MLVMNATEARANFSTLLKRVEKDGAAIVRKSNGRSFKIIVDEPEVSSPFDGIKPVANLSLDEVLDIIHSSHERA